MKIIFLGFSLFCIACALVSDSKYEPRCYSRFDYEYKVVQKLVDLENGANKQMARNQALEDELETIKSMIKQRVGGLEERNEQLNNDIEDMKIANEGLKNEIEAMKAQVLELKGANKELSVSCQEKTTTFNADGGGDSRYLDRHSVHCSQQQFLSNFRLERNRANVKQFRYRYTCCSVK